LPAFALFILTFSIYFWPLAMLPRTFWTKQLGSLINPPHPVFEIDVWWKSIVISKAHLPAIAKFCFVFCGYNVIRISRLNFSVTQKFSRFFPVLFYQIVNFARLPSTVPATSTTGRLNLQTGTSHCSGKNEEWPGKALWI